MDDIEIETVSKLVYVGHAGEFFDTAVEATTSLVRHQLSLIITDSQIDYGFDPDAAADALIGRADTVRKLLAALGDAGN